MPQAISELKRSERRTEPVETDEERRSQDCLNRFLLGPCKGQKQTSTSNEILYSTLSMEAWAGSSSARVFTSIDRRISNESIAHKGWLKGPEVSKRGVPDLHQSGRIWSGAVNS